MPLSLATTILMSLINIGFSTALNIISSLAEVSLLINYLIIMSCLVWWHLCGAPLLIRQ